MRQICVLLLVLPLIASLPAAAQQPTLETEEKKILYALGLAVSRRMLAFDLSEEELKIVEAGMADGVMRREPRVDLQVFGRKIDELGETRSAALAELEKGHAAKFCEQAAQEKGAVTLESGMVYREIEPGSGDSPGRSTTVRVDYHGTLRDGTVFDSTVDRGEPTEFRLTAVIACFKEGLQKMKVGGKSVLTCPASLAYQEFGKAPMIRPGAALAFEIELLALVEPPPRPSRRDQKAPSSR